MPMQSYVVAQLIREASLADGQQSARGKAGIQAVQSRDHVVHQQQHDSCMLNASCCYSTGLRPLDSAISFALRLGFFGLPKGSSTACCNTTCCLERPAPAVGLCRCLVEGSTDRTLG